MEEPRSWTTAEEAIKLLTEYSGAVTSSALSGGREVFEREEAAAIKCFEAMVRRQPTPQEITRLMV